MLKWKNVLWVVVGGATWIAGGQAHASDQDLRATTVPATACQPVGPGASLIELSPLEPAWRFAPMQNGVAMLYCPLPLNNRTVSMAGDDNDINGAGYRVLYRDSDGGGAMSVVTVRLIFRGPLATNPVPGSAWSSNTSAQVGDAEDNQAFNHDLQNALYSFEVRLLRAAGEDTIFRGIDFP